ncbi:MAG: dUTP diphosphatase [Fusobacteriaceae bacterium]
MTFKNVCKIQKNGDSGIIQLRERDLLDISMSAIAEVIEFNEACEKEYSHKTWKRTKHFDNESKLEELADILIFVLQYVNAISIDERCIDSYEDDFNSCFKNAKGLVLEEFNFKKVTLSLVNDLAINNVFGIFLSFAMLTIMCKSDKTEILNIAKKKMEFNQTRKDRVIV